MVKLKEILRSLLLLSTMTAFFGDNLFSDKEIQGPLLSEACSSHTSNNALHIGNSIDVIH